MRPLYATTVVAAALLTQGCAANCPAPQTLNGQVFKMFANHVELLSSAEDLKVFTAAPDFISYGSPANGKSEWVIDWGPANLGAVRVTIDDQRYDAKGDWNPVECGNFFLEFKGDYQSPDGVTHSFSTYGNFVQHDNKIHGELEWLEHFSNGAGKSGRYRAIVAIEGTL